MTMTDPSNPHPEISIQTGDYIIRSDGPADNPTRRYVLCVTSVGVHDYETRQVKNASVTALGNLVVPDGADVLGRKSSIRIEGFVREKRYRHVPRAVVLTALPPPVEHEPPADPEPLLSTADRLIAALDRSTAAAERLTAMLEDLGAKGQRKLNFGSASSNGAQRAAG
jgi:hypothetical protein